MRRSTRNQRGRTAVTLAALLLVASVPAPTATDAAWSANHFTRATLTAGVVPPPAITACTLRREGLLNTVTGVVVSWRLPAGYRLADARLYRVTTGLALEPVTGFDLGSTNSVQGPDGSLTTTIPTTLLGGLVTLGGTTRFTFQVNRSGWTASADVLVSSGLLSISSCSPA